MSFITDLGVTRLAHRYKQRRAGRVTPYLLMATAIVLGTVALPKITRWLREDDDKTPPLASDAPSIVAEGARSITLRDQAGRKIWEFSARNITISADKKFCTANEVKRGVLYRNGQPYLQLQARQVRLNQQTRDLDATGTVSAKGPDGFTVRTERAHWTHRAQRLDCPDTVHATLRRLTFDTKPIFYDAGRSELHCPQAVRVGSDEVKLQGADVVANTKTRVVEFRNGMEMIIVRGKARSLFGGATLLGATMTLAVLSQAQGATKSAVVQPVAETATTSDKVGAVRISNAQGVWDDDKKVGRVTKNVKVWQDGEDFILYCDELTYNKNKNQAIAKVNVKVESRDSTITGTQIFADFDAKKITVTGNVVMNSHGSDDGIKGSAPSNSGGKRRKLPKQLEGKQSTMTCTKIVYDYENHEAEVTGNIHMVQGGNSGTCDLILFDEENNRARLTGNVKFTNSDNQTFESPLVIVWIDENRIQTGRGSFTIPQTKGKAKERAKKTDFGPAPELPKDIIDEFDKQAPTAPAVTAKAGDEKNKATEGSEEKATDNKQPTSTPVEEDKSAPASSNSKVTKTAARDG